MSASLPFFRLRIEGACGSTPAQEGPDAVFREDSQFQFDVTDLAQTCLHIGMYDDAVNSNVLIACGMIPMHHLVRFGQSVGEVSMWLCLQTPNVVYFPTHEDYTALSNFLRPGIKKKKKKKKKKPHPLC